MRAVRVSEIDLRKWVNAKEAAEMLGVHACYAGSVLKSAGIEALYVLGDFGHAFYYWRAAVRKVARDREQERQIPPGYIGIKEAAEAFGVKVPTLRWYISLKGDIPYKVVRSASGRSMKVYPQLLVKRLLGK